MSAAAENSQLLPEGWVGSVAVMTTTMIGSGLYDATEVALLCGLTSDQVVRWSVPTALRTKAVPITGADAARLKMQRFRDLRRRKRSAGTKLRPAESGLEAIADWCPNESWDDWTDPTAAP